MRGDGVVTSEPSAGRLRRIDAICTRAETLLACAVFLTEAIVFLLWVALKGLSAPPDSESAAGWAVRAVIGAVVFGAVAARLFKRFRRAQAVATTGAILLGAAVAPLWRSFPVDYASNLLNWIQQSSSLTLFGGLRGVGTRLTVALLFIGGALASGAGRHITIDLVTRALRGPLQRGVATASLTIAAAVCATASWGFFDHVAIENFGAKPDDTVRQKVACIVHVLGEQAYALRRQAELDVRSLKPIVLEGRSYAQWLTGAEWNAWIERRLTDRYDPATIATLRMPEHERRAPMVSLPGLGELRGELAKSGNLIFPIGFFWLALRLLLRAARTWTHLQATPSEPAEGALAEGTTP